MTPETLARYFDHTQLAPEATPAQIDQLCDEATRWGFAAVCINPIYTTHAARRLDGSDVAVCTVTGFPLGAEPTATKVDQACRAVDDGATEIDMVVHLGALITGNEAAVTGDIAAVAEAVHRVSSDNILKVILETAALTDEQIERGCRCVLAGGADFVKTSTGTHKAGGATVEAVGLLARSAWPLPVKAAGGIRTLATARQMIDAGASRLGASASVAIMAECTAIAGNTGV